MVALPCDRGPHKIQQITSFPPDLAVEMLLERDASQPGWREYILGKYFFVALINFRAFSTGPLKAFFGNFYLKFFFLAAR
jgi:hypothetical protein